MTFLLSASQVIIIVLVNLILTDTAAGDATLDAAPSPIQPLYNKRNLATIIIRGDKHKPLEQQHKISAALIVNNRFSHARSLQLPANVDAIYTQLGDIQVLDAYSARIQWQLLVQRKDEPESLSKNNTDGERKSCNCGNLNNRTNSDQPLNMTVDEFSKEVAYITRIDREKREATTSLQDVPIHSADITRDNSSITPHWIITVRQFTTNETRMHTIWDKTGNYISPEIQNARYNYTLIGLQELTGYQICLIPKQFYIIDTTDSSPSQDSTGNSEPRVSVKQCREIMTPRDVTKFAVTMAGACAAAGAVATATTVIVIALCCVCRGGKKKKKTSDKSIQSTLSVKELDRRERRIHINPAMIQLAASRTNLTEKDKQFIKGCKNGFVFLPQTMTNSPTSLYSSRPILKGINSKSSEDVSYTHGYKRSKTGTPTGNSTTPLVGRTHNVTWSPTFSSLTGSTSLPGLANHIESPTPTTTQAAAYMLNEPVRQRVRHEIGRAHV